MGIPARERAKRRGSTFILVLAVLSILVLIAATLSYTARLEELSSRNYADGVQARMAAVSGIDTFFSIYDGLSSGVLEPWVPPVGVLENQPGAALATAPYVPTPTPPPFSPAVGSQPPVGPQRVSRSATGRMIPRQPTPPSFPRPMPPAFPTSATVPALAPQISALGPQPSTPGPLPADASGEYRLYEPDNLSEIETNLIHLRVRDESAKININALGSWEELDGLRSAGVPAREGSVGVPARATYELYSSPADPIRPTTAPLEAGPPLGLAAALYAVLSAPEVNYPDASPAMARELARAILRYRYGPDGRPGRAGIDDDGDGPAGIDPATAGNIPAAGLDTPYRGSSSLITQPSSLIPRLSADGLDNDFDGVADEPGEGIDEPDEFVADPRRKPYGDDRPFRSVEELLRVEGMTPELYIILKPHVTVFSASERRAGPDRNAPAPVDLNAASDREIYERLRAAFPEVSPEVCAQFAANIADYRDLDSIPMNVQLEGLIDPILGLEITPYITEIWPQSNTDRQDGDDGQYIEIHNPYDVAIPIDGWSVRIRGGSSVRLRGVLVAGAYAIVTDDYNEAQDPTPEDEESGYGSFYDIFRAVPNHRNRLLIEDPSLEIPDKNGAVELVDAAGNLIDIFRYGGEAPGGLTRSYQRSDPRLRVVQVARCTPFAAAGQLRDRYGLATVAGTLASAEIRNAPFRSVFDLFRVCSTYLGDNSRAGMPTLLDDSRAGMPALHTPTIAQLLPDNFDARLADVFTVWTNGGPRGEGRGGWGADGLKPALRTGAGDYSTTAALLAQALATSLTECGRLNVNTAAPGLLGALEGITDRQIDYLMVQRAIAPRIDRVGIPVVYTCWHELLADDDFWDGAPDHVRLARAARWLNSLTFDSKSFRIVSENLRERVTGPRLASRARVEALVSTDGTQNQVVAWRFMQ